MRVLMIRDAGGKQAGTEHVLTYWAAMNFIRAHAAKWLEDTPGEPPFPLGPRFRVVRQMPRANDRMMRGGHNR